MRSWNSNLEQAQYHYFNSNGAIRKHDVMMQTLFEAVDAGNINSGWLIAHDGEFHREHIIALTQMQRVRGYTLRYHVEALRKETEATYIQLGEVLLGIRGPNGMHTSLTKIRSMK